MDLPAAEGECAAKIDQPVPDNRSIFKNIELVGKKQSGGRGIGDRLGLCPELRASDNRDELTQDLPAYGQSVSPAAACRVSAARARSRSGAPGAEA